jgi:hypothetical protein
MYVTAEYQTAAELQIRRQQLESLCAVVQLNMKQQLVCNYCKYSLVGDCTVCTVFVQ